MATPIAPQDVTASSPIKASFSRNDSPNMAAQPAFMRNVVLPPDASARTSGGGSTPPTTGQLFPRKI